MAWDSIINGTNEGTDKKEIKYLKFADGANAIRLLDAEPFSRWTHWIAESGQKGCSIDCIGKGCPVCEVSKQERALGKKGTELTYRTSMTHSVNVLNRANGEVAILEKGNKIFQDIAMALTMLEQMGKPKDITTIDVIVNKSGGPSFNTIKYNVMPNLATIGELTETEKALEKFNLQELKPKLNREQVLQMMNGKTLEEVCKTEESVQPGVDTTIYSTTGLNVDFNMAQ